MKRNEIKIEGFQCPAGKLVVEPFKHMVRTTTITDFEPEPVPEGIDPTKDEYEPQYVPVKKKTKAPYEMQLATVISSGSDQFPKGTIVVYSIKFVKEFDLFKDALLMSQHDVMGVMQA